MLVLLTRLTSSRQFTRGIDMSRISDAIIAHYRMNDNLATDVILDAVGSHNGAVKDAGGTATSAAHSAEGLITKAQDLDGNDDYIEVADHADFTPALTPFSVIAWVNMDDATQFQAVSKWGNAEDNREWSLFVDASDLLKVTIYDETPNTKIGRVYSVARTGDQGAWVLLGFTYDGGTASAGCKLYHNGRRVDDGDNESGTFVTVQNAAGAVRIGRRSTNYANGRVDSVMILDIELTDDDMMRIFNAGRGTELHCEMDEGRTRERGLRRAG